MFKKPEQEWSRMRTQHLQRLMKRGTTEARQAAHKIFQGLKANGVKTKYQQSLMLKLGDGSILNP